MKFFRKIKGVVISFLAQEIIGIRMYDRDTDTDLQKWSITVKDGIHFLITFDMVSRLVEYFMKYINNSI